MTVPTETLKYLVRPGSRVLAAVSGGADSVAMLHILCTLRDRLDITVICGHINHQLRGEESDADQRFVEDLAGQYGIAFYCQQVDVRDYAARCRLSIETAGRTLRLGALERIAGDSGCTHVATAHHKDDQAETLLLRLLRGTSFTGLAGIRPAARRNGLYIIRPMLAMRRSEVEGYCKQNNLRWREDKSNRLPNFKRNWVRHLLLPYFRRRCEGDIVEKLFELSESACRMQSRLEESAGLLWNDTKTEQGDGRIVFEAGVLRTAGPLITGQILRTVFTVLNCGQRDLTERHYHQVFMLLREEDSAQVCIELPGGCTVRREGERVVFFRRGGSVAAELSKDAIAELPAEGQVQFDTWLIHSRVFELKAGQFPEFLARNNPYCQWFDCDKLTLPLVVRRRKPGDKFIPFGAKGVKRLGKFLTDGGFDDNTRQNAVVVEDQNTILWLAPVRRSVAAAVTDGTKKILAVELTFLR